MSATILVLAAGMASRYGSLKQIDKFGPSGESIIDYSIYDAIEAGFTKVVFVIRKEFEEEFKEIFESRLKNKIEVNYAYQQNDSFINSLAVTSERIKPWGTAHAVLCASNIIDEPFAVINADDFYGRHAFKKAHHFITEEVSHDLWANICYELGNTLSEHGYVSRGICETDKNNFITSVVERIKVYRENNHIVFEENEQLNVLPGKAKASMNFWCFSPDIFDFLLMQFHEFLNKNANDLKAEFFIPMISDEFIKMGKGNIKAITTADKWVGVTYKEDKALAQQFINQLIEQGTYPRSLWQQQRLYELK